MNEKCNPTGYNTIADPSYSKLCKKILFPLFTFCYDRYLLVMDEKFTKHFCQEASLRTAPLDS